MVFLSCIEISRASCHRGSTVFGKICCAIMDIDKINTFLSILATALSLIAIFKNTISKCYHYVRMNWLKRSVASYLTNRLVAATDEPERSSIIESCAARCSCFGEEELVTLWKAMYFYWANKTAAGSVEVLFMALQSLSETSESALMSFCKLILDNPSSSDHLLPAFSRFLLTTRFARLSPSRANTLRDALVALKTQRLTRGAIYIFQFVDLAHLCMNMRHDSPDAIYEALDMCLDLTTPDNGDCGQLKICVDALLHLNDILFQLRTQNKLRAAGEVFISFANIINDNRVHLSPELIEQLLEIDVQQIRDPGMSPGMWHVRYATRPGGTLSDM